MGLLTNVFYLISTALLIPVMLALLWYLTRALVLVGQTLREYVVRAREKRSLAGFAKALEDPDGPLPEVPTEGAVADALSRLARATGDTVLVDKVIRDSELQWNRELERLRTLVRNGPALGLMGTLIPLGPALVGLAAGDIQSMADNLIIAFATTVVGLLIAMIGGGLLSLKKGWYQDDDLLLAFAAERFSQRLAPTPREQANRPQATLHRCRCASGNGHEELAAVGCSQEEV